VQVEKVILTYTVTRQTASTSVHDHVQADFKLK